MPRHLISDAHEWINEIPTVPIYYLARAKRGKGGVVATVDIAKAFDTVPHSAFLSSLKEKGIHPLMADIICKMYEGITTALPDGSTVEIFRGVKQGDPLSPLCLTLLLIIH